MNAFQYSLAIKKIDTLTTQKAREEFAREMHDVLNKGYRYKNFDDESINVSDAIRAYKCLAKVIPLYTGKNGLPYFIHRMHNDIMDRIVSYFNSSPSVDYNKIENAFEFNTSVNLGNKQPTDFMSLIQHISNNIPHFKLSYSVYPSTRFRYLFTDTKLKYKHTELLLELEELKRSLDPSIKYTLLEDMLTTYYKKSAVTFTQPAYSEMELMWSTFNNLQQSADTIRERITGE